MAAVTIRRIKSVVVVDVAGSAGRRGRGHMRSRQGKTRRAVVKPCRGPTYRRVARRTICGRKGRSRSRMHGIVRLLPSRQVAP